MVSSYTALVLGMVSSYTVLVITTLSKQRLGFPLPGLFSSQSLTQTAKVNINNGAYWEIRSLLPFLHNAMKCAVVLPLQDPSTAAQLIALLRDQGPGQMRV